MKQIIYLVVFCLNISFIFSQSKGTIKSPSTFFPKEKVKVLVVGTFHFNYPNLDVNKIEDKEKIDVLSEPKKSENLAQRQYALLCAALLAVKPGGIVVYSTCSINPKENDQVIARLLKRKGDDFQLLNLPLPEGAEKTQFGVQFMPDVCGFGPMYCCKLQRYEGLSSNRT